MSVQIAFLKQFLLTLLLLSAAVVVASPPSAAAQSAKWVSHSAGPANVPVTVMLDHLTGPIVRDHTSKPMVRDHRNQVDTCINGQCAYHT
jgi:hypothetical protein